jgi:hypothetical protein
MADNTSTGLAVVNATYAVVTGTATAASGTAAVASRTAAAPVTTAARSCCPRLPATPGLALGQR